MKLRFDVDEQELIFDLEPGSTMTFCDEDGEEVIRYKLPVSTLTLETAKALEDLYLGTDGFAVNEPEGLMKE